MSTSKGWLFFNGDQFYVNADLNNDYEDGYPEVTIPAGTLVLRIDLNATPTRAIGNRLNTINYTGLIALGRKKDPDDTEASLDESFDQKYLRRLKELLQTLSTEIGKFACGEELQIVSESYIYDINEFDTNIDFVAGTFNILQETFSTS